MRESNQASNPDANYPIIRPNHHTTFPERIITKPERHLQQEQVLA